MTICELATLDARPLSQTEWATPLAALCRSSAALPSACHRSEAVLKPMYANFLRNGHSHREAPEAPARPHGAGHGKGGTGVPEQAGFLFMDWLGSIAKAGHREGVKTLRDMTILRPPSLAECQRHDPTRPQVQVQALTLIGRRKLAKVQS